MTPKTTVSTKQELLYISTTPWRSIYHLQKAEFLRGTATSEPWLEEGPPANNSFLVQKSPVVVNEANCACDTSATSMRVVQI